jgi:F0F1-type ATP synthase delta subunit
MQKDFSTYLDIITMLKTTQEVTNFTSEIDTLMLSFFKAENTSIKEPLNSISSESAQKIIQTFSKNNLDINNKDTINIFLKTLKGLLKKLKVIKLILAFSPNHKTIENIHNFVKETIGIGFILDIEVSEDVLGGSIVMFNGKYSDFSLKKSIEDAFDTKNKNISQPL